MNERLRELMLEEGYAAPEIAPRANKLAELSVRECINQISDLMDYTEYTDPSANEVELGALRDARRAIEEHFGVEE